MTKNLYNSNHSLSCSRKGLERMKKEEIEQTFEKLGLLTEDQRRFYLSFHIPMDGTGQSIQIRLDNVSKDLTGEH